MYQTAEYNQHAGFEAFKAARLDLKNHIKNYCIAAEVTEEPEARHLYAETREIIKRVDDKIQNQLIPLLEKQALERHPDVDMTISFMRKSSPRGREFACIQGVPFYDYETVKTFNTASQLYRYNNEDRENFRGNEYYDALNAMKVAEQVLDKYLTTEPIEIYQTSDLLYKGQDELAQKICQTALSSENTIFHVDVIENHGANTPKDCRYFSYGTMNIKSNGLEPYIAKFIADNFELPLELYNGGYAIGKSQFDRIEAHFETQPIGSSKTQRLTSFRFDLYDKNERIFQAYLFTNGNMDYYKLADDVVKRAAPVFYANARKKEMAAQGVASPKSER